jgi:hypothetical protein
VSVLQLSVGAGNLGLEVIITVRWVSLVMAAGVVVISVIP